MKEEQNWLTVDLVSDLYLGSEDEKLRNRQRAIELIDTTFVEDTTVDVALAPIISESLLDLAKLRRHGNGRRYFRFSLLKTSATYCRRGIDLLKFFPDSWVLLPMNLFCSTRISLSA